MREFGAPAVLVLTDVPDPVQRDGDALIEVEVANITFVETQVRAGHAPNPAMLPKLPAILGNGVGGRLAGTRVIASLNGTGGYASRAVASRDAVIEIPPELALNDALALLADGRTAMQLLRGAAIQPGETVLVHAAAGGVGSLLLQLARHAGAEVIGAAGGERKVAVAHDLGAHAGVDYALPGWANAVGEVDVVFDGVGGAIGRAGFELLRRGGRFLPFGMASGQFAPVSDADALTRGVALVRMAHPSQAESRALTQAALDEAVAGRLRPLIGQTFPLEQAAEAHQSIEQRQTIGKTLLLV